MNNHITNHSSGMKLNLSETFRKLTNSQTAHKGAGEKGSSDITELE